MKKAVPLLTRQLCPGTVRAPVLTSLVDEADVPEAVLFVHGNPGSRLDWEALAAAVAPYIPVLAPDMPGFGAADKPRDFPYSVAAGADFIEQLRQQLHIRRLHLVLHDFGGPWGLHWAADHPAQVASITLINTGVMPGYRWHALARLWRTPLLGELFQRITNLQGFRATLNRANPRPLPDDFIRRMYAHYDAGTRRAVLRLYRATPHPGGDALAMAERLAPLDLPALVLWGDADPYLPVRHAHSQKLAFPRAQVVEIAGAGHWPFVEFPQQVEDALLDFLRPLAGRC